MRNFHPYLGRALALLAMGAIVGAAAPTFAVTIITNSPLPPATAGSSYSKQLEAVTNIKRYPLRWYAQDPGCFAAANLNLSPEGVLKGVAANPGTYNCLVIVQQYNGDGTDYDRKFFALEVRERPAPPQITSTCPEPATYGVAYTKQISVTGTEPIAVAVTGLPKGLVFEPLARQITGTPQEAGSFALAIRASSRVPPDASQACDFTVARAPAKFTFTVLPNPAVEGQAVIATGTLAGGNPAPGGAVQFWIASSTARCPAPFEQSPLPVTTLTQTVPLDGAGQAKASFAALIPDVYHACAAYLGDAVYDPARAGPVDLFVIKGVLLATPKLTLEAPASVAPGQVLSPRIKVSGDGARPPEGRVALRVDGREIGSAALGDGTAVVSTTAPVAGQLELTAAYYGDAVYAPAVSDAALVVVLKAAAAEAVPSLSDAALVLLALLVAAFAAARLAGRRPR